MEIAEKLKIKPLTKSQIVISIDRLTRFKFTEEKYLRVFKDIIVANLISPKYRKNQLDLMEYEMITRLATEIFNSSLVSGGLELTCDYSINLKLLEYEKSIFKFDKNIQKLLENKFDFKSAINFLDNNTELNLTQDIKLKSRVGLLSHQHQISHDSLPLNLKWLKSLSTEQCQVQNRAKAKTKFPLEKIIITEGITEEILLPKFAKLCGYDFDEHGVYLIAAGGKNQVVKLFYQFAEELKLPVFVLLDNDAKENFAEISPKLRKIDKVHVIANGEFEDILPLNLIKKTLNNYLKNFSSVSLDELRRDLPMTKILDEIFKQKGFNEFKKAEFAHLVAENISVVSDVSQSIAAIIEEIKSI